MQRLFDELAPCALCAAGWLATYLTFAPIIVAHIR